MPGKNAEQTASNFLNDAHIYVPRIYWKQTATRILTMEFIDGVKITDKKAMYLFLCWFGVAFLLQHSHDGIYVQKHIFWLSNDLLHVFIRQVFEVPQLQFILEFCIPPVQ